MAILVDSKLDQLNIQNLVALWELFPHRITYIDHIKIIYHTSWPFRLWFPDFARPQSISSLIETDIQFSLNANIPLWLNRGEEGRAKKQLANAGYNGYLQQIAMFYEINKDENNDVEPLVRVTNELEVERWSLLVSKAFGYYVDEVSVKKLLNNEQVRLYLYEVDGIEVATALLFKTGKIAGIHYIGVRPEYRGKGIAKDLMRCLHHVSTKLGCRYTTLQASPQGKKLYESLGYSEQFRYDNYRRKSQ